MLIIVLQNIRSALHNCAQNLLITLQIVTICTKMRASMYNVDFRDREYYVCLKSECLYLLYNTMPCEIRNSEMCNHKLILLFGLEKKIESD